MKNFIVGSMLCAVSALVGCGQGSTSGGPGVTKNPDNATALTQKDDTFSLDAPNLATKVGQGESKVVNLSINRGKNFDEEVAIKFDNVPKGVTIDPAAPMVKHGYKSVDVTVQAAADAALGDHVVKVTGTPSKGLPAWSEMKVTIAAK